MRLFIGIKTSPAVTELCLSLQKALPDEARLVHAEDLHLTLLPPWEVEEGELGQVEAQIRNVLKSFKPFTISLEALEMKSIGKEAGVIWIRCKMPPELIELKNALEEAFGRKEERGFLPHITLAKIAKDQIFWEGKMIKKREMNTIMPVTSLEFFESRPKEEIKYSVLASFKLG